MTVSAEIVSQLTQGVKMRAPGEGPRVLVVGAMHGNEPVGVRWMYAMVQAFTEGALRLIRGEIHMLLGNPQAFARGERHCGFDLNRAFRSELLNEHPPRSPDVARAQEIANLLANERYDVVVDLHSVSRGDPAMVVVRVRRDEPDAAVGQLKGQFPVAFPIVFAYQPSDVPGIFLDWASRELGATTAYAVECGNHESPRGEARAWAFARWLFGEHLGIIEGKWPQAVEDVSGDRENAAAGQRVYRVVERIDASEDFVWTLPTERIHSESPLAKGEAYARRGAKVLRAPEDAALMMPALTFAPHDEAIAFLCRRVA